MNLERSIQIKWSKFMCNGWYYHINKFKAEVKTKLKLTEVSNIFTIALKNNDVLKWYHLLYNKKKIRTNNK